MGYLTMNNKEREQAKVFEQVKQGIITQAEAAARLRITARWVRKKLKRYYELGDLGLIHLSRGRASGKKWDYEQELLLISLLQSEWRGFGPTFATEKLQELYQIKVSSEVVRQAMIRANLWAAKSKRSKHRSRRERKPMFGMMTQLDGSPHDWFEGRAARCTLLVLIDDATSQIVHMQFASSESNQSILDATKNYVQKQGAPRSFYVDFGGAFHVNLNNPEHDKKTQWERACKQLGIEIIHAHSPQAKGRVERCNKTMQDRLIKEMRLANICSIEQANVFLQTSDFIIKHNEKYAVKPAQLGDAHIDRSEYDLKDVFSIYNERTLANDFTLMFEKRIFQLHKQQRTLVKPKDLITVKTSLAGVISLWIRKTKLNFHEISDKPIKPAKEKIVSNRIYKPSENSRRWADGLPPLSRVKPAQPAAEASNCDSK